MSSSCTWTLLSSLLLNAEEGEEEEGVCKEEEGKKGRGGEVQG